MCVHADIKSKNRTGYITAPHSYAIERYVIEILQHAQKEYFSFISSPVTSRARKNRE